MKYFIRCFVLLFVISFNYVVQAQDDYLKNSLYTGVGIGFHGTGDETIGTFYAGWLKKIGSSKFQLNLELGVSTMVHNPYKLFTGRLHPDELTTFLTINNVELFYVPFVAGVDQFGGTIELPGKLDSRTDVEISIGGGYELLNKRKNII